MEKYMLFHGIASETKTRSDTENPCWVKGYIGNEVPKTNLGPTDLDFAIVLSRNGLCQASYRHYGTTFWKARFGKEFRPHS